MAHLLMSATKLRNLHDGPEATASSSPRSVQGCSNLGCFVGVPVCDILYSSLASSRCPSAKAKAAAVLPSLSVISGSAPCDSKYLTTEVRPIIAAPMRGVLTEPPSLLLTSAPLSTKRVTRARSPSQEGLRSWARAVMHNAANRYKTIQD